jgi:hypothetical protein
VQLIESYEPCICLSYVWGGYTASKETPNIGSQLPVQIPKTIKDAIQVANRLGIPLLWVDQYCFDQNDISMRTATIESMDLIHGAAAITIIVASGADASSGLPDVRGTTRKRQNILIRNQMKCFASIDIDISNEISASHWNTRGWTFQEEILSARTLTFIDSQVFFQCKKGIVLRSRVMVFNNSSTFLHILDISQYPMVDLLPSTTYCWNISLEI